jgi:hypothetical protein
VAQSVERVLGKDEVLGSNPSGSFGESLLPGNGRWHDRWRNRLGRSHAEEGKFPWDVLGLRCGAGGRVGSHLLTSGMPQGVAHEQE